MEVFEEDKWIALVASQHEILPAIGKIIGRNGTDAGGEVKSQSKVFEWHHGFKDGHKYLEDLCNVWSVTFQDKVNMIQVQEDVFHQMVGMTAEKIRILIGSCHTILRIKDVLHLPIHHTKNADATAI